MLVFFTNSGLMEVQVRYLALFFLFLCFGWFWIGTLHKNIQLMLESLKGGSILGRTLYLLYISGLPGVIYVMACAVYLSFIVTCVHQKMKASFCHINFDYTTNFLLILHVAFSQNCLSVFDHFVRLTLRRLKMFCFSFYFFSFEYKKRKEKYMLNSIMLKIYFNVYLIIVIYFMNFMNFDFIFIFLFFQRKKVYTIKLVMTLNF